MEIATKEELKTAIWPMWESGKAALPQECALEIKQFGAGGVYFPETKKIELGLEELGRDGQRFQEIREKKPTLKQMAELSLAHEMGHAKDETLENNHRETNELFRLAGEKLDKDDEIGFMIAHAKIGKIRKAYEEKAWKLGEAFLPEDFDMDLYNKAKTRFLETYDWKWQQEQACYLAARKLIRWMRAKGLKEKPDLNIDLFGDEAIAYCPEKKMISFSFAAADLERRYSETDISFEETALFLCLRETAKAGVLNLEERLEKIKRAKKAAYEAGASGNIDFVRERTAEWEAASLEIEAETAFASEERVPEEIKEKLRALNAQKERAEKENMAQKRDFLEEICKEKAEKRLAV